MVINASAIVILGLAVLLMMRSGRHHWGFGMACVVLGFLLAKTSVEPAMTSFLEGVVHAVSSLTSPTTS
jgi:uncharacterized membrane protein YgaE (UPF0421/DUF939 family)